jgi:hypothetical protein
MGDQLVALQRFPRMHGPAEVGVKLARRQPPQRRRQRHHRQVGLARCQPPQRLRALGGNLRVW